MGPPLGGVLGQIWLQQCEWDQILHLFVFGYREIKYWCYWNGTCAQSLGKQGFPIYMKYIYKCWPTPPFKEALVYIFKYEIYIQVPTHTFLYTFHISKFFSSVSLYDRRLQSYHKFTDNFPLDLIIVTFMAITLQPSIRNPPNLRELWAWGRYTTYIQMEFFQ